VKGLSADPGEIAVDLVAHVMDGDRNFLAERRTVQHLRSGEVWLPELSVQEARWEAWREAGGPTLAERARVEAERLLAEHEVPPLPEDQARELDRIVESIEVPA
jgi:trimethylamine:corrinoid methyltransferase-like protein